jgi:hypothetical protein
LNSIIYIIPVKQCPYPNIITMLPTQTQDRRNDPERNGMNDYDRRSDTWNSSQQVQEYRKQRQATINEIADVRDYRTGFRIHHMRLLQMYDINTWNELFGNEVIAPNFQAYVTASLDFVSDDTDTCNFAGQMEVALLMQENYRDRVHLAVFFVYLSPHREFHDGHMIQIEFGEGSHTHQTINRVFDTATHAIVLQATEYQMLNFLAVDADASELLHNCFLNDFNPMRFSYDDASECHIVDPAANDIHPWGQFGGGDYEGARND